MPKVAAGRRAQLVTALRGTKFEAIGAQWIAQYGQFALVKALVQLAVEANVVRSQEIRNWDIPMPVPDKINTWLETTNIYQDIAGTVQIDRPINTSTVRGCLDYLASFVESRMT